MRKFFITAILLFTVFTINHSKVSAREVIGTQPGDYQMTSIATGVLIESYETRYFLGLPYNAPFYLPGDPSDDDYIVFLDDSTGDYILISGWINLHLEYYVYDHDLTIAYIDGNTVYFYINDVDNIHYTSNPSLPGYNFSY